MAKPTTTDTRLAMAKDVRGIVRDPGSASVSGAHLRRRVWRWCVSWRNALIPLMFALAVAVAGFWAVRTVDETSRHALWRQLEVTLNGGEQAVRVYLEGQRAASLTAAADTRVVSLTEALLARRGAAGDTASEVRAALVGAPEQAALTEQLVEVLTRHQLEGFALTAFDGTILASDDEASIGSLSALRAAPFMRRAFDGHVSLSLPQRVSIHGLSAEDALAHPEHVFIAEAPVVDSQGRIRATLGLRSLPRVVFSDVLGMLAFGDTGETYVFNSDAVMLSASRFAQALVDVPISGQRVGAARVDIQLVDPGSDLRRGEFRKVPNAAADLPLTLLARSATRGHTDAQLDGYRTYHGGEVVGSWRWLADLGFGIASEVAVREAYDLRSALHTVLWVLGGLLLLGALVGLVYSVVVRRLRGRVDRVEKLGQYRLKRKIGEGGMGEVYLAEHALLRRPTAIKLIRTDAASNEAVARFEREVQLTAQLTNPHTIAIFDYGRTESGVFFYAMEYIDGIDLELLVRRDGPQCPERVAYLLLGVVSSLCEAHRVGFVHRDIKPSNIMLSDAGGEGDRVKVLDFGLVKQIAEAGDVASDARITADFSITGTPHFLAPESAYGGRNADFRSDHYAVGAVAYWLLTGRTLFPYSETLAVIAAQCSETPKPCSAHNIEVPKGLEDIMLRCLRKDPAERFQSTEALREALDAFERTQPERWTWARAEAWWRTNPPVAQAPCAELDPSGALDPTQLAISEA